jgi:hypothetical protein
MPATAATVLNPGETLYIPGEGLAGPYYSTSLPSWLTSGNLVASLSSPYTGSITGDLLTWVYRDPAPGTPYLGFEYRFFVTTGKKDLATATIGGADNPWWGVTITDAGANGIGKSTAEPSTPHWTNGDPYYISRDDNVDGAGIQIYWRNGNAGTTIHPGNQYSALIWFVTNSEVFQPCTVGLEDSGGVSSADSFAPVPEPVSMVFFGTGIVAVFGFVARRRMLKQL